MSVELFDYFVTFFFLSLGFYVCFKLCDPRRLDEDIFSQGSQGIFNSLILFLAGVLFSPLLVLVPWTDSQSPFKKWGKLVIFILLIFPIYIVVRFPSPFLLFSIHNCVLFFFSIAILGFSLFFFERLGLIYERIIFIIWAFFTLVFDIWIISSLYYHFLPNPEWFTIIISTYLTLFITFQGFKAFSFSNSERDIFRAAKIGQDIEKTDAFIKNRKNHVVWFLFPATVFSIAFDISLLILLTTKVVDFSNEGAVQDFFGSVCQIFAALLALVFVLFIFVLERTSKDQNIKDLFLRGMKGATTTYGFVIIFSFFGMVLHFHLIPDQDVPFELTFIGTTLLFCTISMGFLAFIFTFILFYEIIDDYRKFSVDPGSVGTMPVGTIPVGTMPAVIEPLEKVEDA